MLQKGLESAKFDIRDIRGGFDTGQLFANNNLEHKRSDHIWTLSTMRTFLFGIIKSFTDLQLRQSLAMPLKEYRSSRRAVYFILQLHYKKPITYILPSPSLYIA